MSDHVPPDAPSPPPVQPGEVPPPGTRLLERAPGKRYAATAEQGPAEPRWPVAILLGLGAALLSVVLWVVGGGILDLSGGLLVLAVVAGWMIGAAVRQGAWSGQPHARDARSVRLAVGLGLSAWLVGEFLVYLYAEATLPGSTLPVAERLAATPFVVWLSPQLLPLPLLGLILIAIAAWWAAR